MKSEAVSSQDHHKEELHEEVLYICWKIDRGRCGIYKFWRIVAKETAIKAAREATMSWNVSKLN